MYSYFTKVVPTNYVYSVTKKRDVEMSHQISVTRTMKDILAGAGGIPGIFFQYGILST
jgi:hypothetical protein